MHSRIAHDEWISRAEMQPEGGESWVLDYYLQTFDGEEGEKYYGLRIDKSTPAGELREREETGAISENREEALIMIKAFAKGSVPPVTLLEMADEWHSENSEAFSPTILLPT